MHQIWYDIIIKYPLANPINKLKFTYQEKKNNVQHPECVVNEDACEWR